VDISSIITLGILLLTGIAWVVTVVSAGKHGRSEPPLRLPAPPPGTM
jgi:hypothetical protein